MSLNTKYLRTLKGQNLMNQYSLDTSYIPVVQCYHNATILPYKKGENFNGFGGVIDENGKYVGLSAEKFVFGKYDIELPVIRDETVCYNQTRHSYFQLIAQLYQIILSDL